jgi:hypothetical protein
MASAGAYPKPDEERIRRNKPSDQGFGWTNLPVKNNSPIPPMPEDVYWSKRAIELWQELWTSPQSTQWAGPLKLTVVKYLALYERFWGCTSPVDEEGRIYPDLSSAVINGMTQCEDRLGLSPKAMLQLRWRVRAEAVEEEAKLAVVQDIPRPKRADPRKKS